jgi:hypothetical protein
MFVASRSMGDTIVGQLRQKKIKVGAVGPIADGKRLTVNSQPNLLFRFPEL